MSELLTFGDARVLVIGDVMLDRFWHGGTTRISPEAPVPVVKVSQVDDRPGGAANVAANLAALGVETTLLGLVGDDEAARQLRSAVEALGVRWSVMPCPADTIVKLRVLSRNQQLIRMDFEHSLADYADASFFQYASNLIAEHDVVLLSDYAKGTLSHIEPLIHCCKTNDVPVLVDPKGTDFERYRGATVITPNLSEFEAVVGVCQQADDTISERAKTLCEQYDFDAVLVTRSERGMTLQSRQGKPLHLPALAREVFDVTGAGDTVISAMAAGLASRSNLENATRLANVAAGLVVGKVGTASVTLEELEGALSEPKSPQGEGDATLNDRICSEAELIGLVNAFRQEGKRVAMTNGCFDILHPGHVAYLNQAAKLADILIVAVNDDASVAALKGEGRPINSVEARMAVLAGLSSVNYVIPFKQNTPARLIEALSPDVLVKGGDYRVTEIAGHEHVIAQGGEVVVLEFVEGFSTTATIGRINAQLND